MRAALGRNSRSDNGHATAHEVGHERWQAIVLALHPVVLDRYILALDVAGFVEALTERNGAARIGRPAVDERDYRHPRLLRARRKRPRRRPGEQRDERAAIHSMTSSVKASNLVGTSSPSVLAVVKLIKNSNLVGCNTGISAGLSPLRIRPV